MRVLGQATLGCQFQKRGCSCGATRHEAVGHRCGPWSWTRSGRVPSGPHPVPGLTVPVLPPASLSAPLRSSLGLCDPPAHSSSTPLRWSGFPGPAFASAPPFPARFASLHPHPTPCQKLPAEAAQTGPPVPGPPSLLGPRVPAGSLCHAHARSHPSAPALARVRNVWLFLTPGGDSQSCRPP